MSYGKTSSALPRGLSFFQLACLMVAPTSLPISMVGDRLATQYGAGTALFSIIAGNLLLWVIGMAFISMVNREHNNAIENIRNYLGKLGGSVVALVLVFAFLNWYALQINSSMKELDGFFHFASMGKGSIGLRLGAFMGLVSALLSIGGVRLFKSMATFCLPLFIAFFIYEIFASDFSPVFQGTWGLSFPAVVTTVLLVLPGFINLPTIFKYSRSKAHSHLALMVIVCLLSFLEIATIWVKFTNVEAYVGVIAGYVVLTLIFSNLLNIYFASACWETFVPRFEGPKGYAVIGLLGTLIYTFLQISAPVQFFEDLTSSYLAILGVVILISFLVRLLIQHRHKPLEKWVSLVSWLFGCTVATMYESYHLFEEISSLMAGVSASILFFLVLFLIEETVWAAKRTLSKLKGTR